MHANQIGHDLRVDVAELAVTPEPGVVHQQVRLRGGDDPLQLGDVTRIGQVRHMNLDAHVVLAGQPLGQGAQPVTAAGRDGQIPAVGGQPAGERLPDSGGCSGHESKHGYLRTFHWPPCCGPRATFYQMRSRPWPP